MGERRRELLHFSTVSSLEILVFLSLFFACFRPHSFPSSIFLFLFLSDSHPSFPFFFSQSSLSIYLFIYIFFFCLPLYFVLYFLYFLSFESSYIVAIIAGI